MSKYILVLVSAFLSSCASMSNLNTARNSVISDNAFFEALRKGYVELADDQYHNGNRTNASKLGDKAMLLVQNKLPEPESLADKPISSLHLQELAASRAFVLDTISQKIQADQPLLVARLQLMYDCWVMEENNTQDMQYNTCRKNYSLTEIKIKQLINNEVAKVSAETIAPLKSAPPIPQPVELIKRPEVLATAREISPSSNRSAPYEIFFKNNSITLDSNAKKVIKDAAIDFEQFNPRKILINGHADRSGSLQHNKELATKRANAVAKYLIKQGVPERLLDIRSYGASAAWVDQIPDDRDERYRSVRIIFLKENKMNYR